MFKVRLEGCRPAPLVHYLKALGILRLVAEQADPGARGYWDGDTFVLCSTLDAPALVDFFLHSYRPTPVVSPWNGGAGFKDSSKKSGPNLIEETTSERFAEYRTVVEKARTWRRRLGITEDVKDDLKVQLIDALRNDLPDQAIRWIDAAAIALPDAKGGRTISYPALLGTGGNDGNFDFSINYIQCVRGLFNVEGEPTGAATALLDNALFGAPVSGLEDSAIGMFQPGAAGGANSSAFAKSKSTTNPWEFVLNFEGALLFTAAVARRFGMTGKSVVSAPFTFRSVAASVGSIARAGAENFRDELWMPLWGQPASHAEVQNLISEGRIQLGGRPAVDALDVVRSIAALGVDRGVNAFQRYAILERNGLAYIAAPLERFEVRRRPEADLVAEIDAWVQRLRSKARGDRVPASIDRAARRLEGEIWSLCEFGRPEDVRRLLLAIGRANRALATSIKWTSDDKIRLPPAPLLSQRWLESLNVNTVEFRLAASLASLSGRYQRAGEKSPRFVSVRENILPIVGRAWDTGAARDVVWRDGDVTGSMSNVLLRRLLWRDDSDVYADRGKVSSSLQDIATFIDGPFDDREFEEYVHALCLIDWGKVETAPASKSAGEGALPDGLYTMLKLAFAGTSVGEAHVVANPQIVRLALSGDGGRATQLAARRLRGSVGTPKISSIDAQGERVRRCAAALLFPVSHSNIQLLAGRLLRSEDLRSNAPA